MNMVMRSGESISARERLVELITEKSFKRADSNIYQLASGKQSDIYFNMKPVLLSRESIHLIADLILKIVYKKNLRNIGGQIIGAVPIVTAVCLKSSPDRPVDALFVRGEAKQHGTRSLVEGNIPEDKEVLIVDDVTTTGGSVLNAVKAVRELGCTVNTVVTVVDRIEGAEEKLQSHGLELIALCTTSDFM